MKTYKFDVKVFADKDNIYYEGVQSWTDKGEPIAKDWLRSSLQIDFRKQFGKMPYKVELKCINSDIGGIPARLHEEGK